MVDPLGWLRDQAAGWVPEAAGLLVRTAAADEPMQIAGFDDLLARLAEAGALVPLPTEPAALANVIEQAMLAFLHERLDELTEAGHDVARGTAGDRAYPDLEISGTYFSSRDDLEHHAVDVKVARRKPRSKGEPTGTQSRITLYTGNTYFKYPELDWPGVQRPFGDYASHLDIVVLYDFNPATAGRVDNVEVLTHPAWRIASTRRSSTTREYIGAVTNLAELREGRGEFETEEEFYRYWRGFNFSTSAQVANILYRLMREQRPEE